MEPGYCIVTITLDVYVQIICMTQPTCVDNKVNIHT